MNKILSLLFILPILSFSQSYNGPESVDYHHSTKTYFISNSSNGQILSLDENENLNVFANNITSNGPHGLEVVGDTIYACSGNKLLGFDVNTGSQILNINIGTMFANGITHKNNDLFITDFSLKKIIRYNILNEQHNIHYNNFPSTPNGIIYDNFLDRLIVVSWGNNAPIYEVDVNNSSHTLLTNTSLYNCDGIAIDNNGNFYVSEWGNNSINKFENNFSTSPSVVVNGLNLPADIYYNKFSDTLAIPNSGNNTVSFIDLGINNLTFPCDSILISYIGLANNNICINVQTEYFSNHSMPYAGFIITNDFGDTIAMENINSAGNVYGLISNHQETRYLELTDTAFNGFGQTYQLHLIKYFFAGNPIIECTYPFNINICSDINSNTNTSKNLIKVIDILGRSTSKETKNQILFYIYDDGTIEKKFRLNSNPFKT